MNAIHKELRDLDDPHVRKDPRRKIPLDADFSCRLESCSYVHFGGYAQLEQHCQAEHIDDPIPPGMGMRIDRCHKCETFCPSDQEYAFSTCQECHQELQQQLRQTFRQRNPALRLNDMITAQLTEAHTLERYIFWRRLVLLHRLRQAEGPSLLFTTQADLAIARARRPASPPHPTNTLPLEKTYWKPVAIAKQKPLLEDFRCTLWNECRQANIDCKTFQGLLSHWTTQHKNVVLDPCLQGMRIAVCHRCSIPSNPKYCLRTSLQESYFCNKCRSAPRQPPKNRSHSQLSQYDPASIPLFDQDVSTTHLMDASDYGEQDDRYAYAYVDDAHPAQYSRSYDNDDFPDSSLPPDDEAYHRAQTFPEVHDHSLTNLTQLNPPHLQHTPRRNYFSNQASSPVIIATPSQSTQQPHSGPANYGPLASSPVGTFVPNPNPFRQTNKQKNLPPTKNNGM